MTAIGVPLADAEVARLAADPDPAVRAEVAVSDVMSGGEERAHTLLATLIESPSPAERSAGLEAVARLRGHAPSPMIVDALADPVPEVRAAAVRAIAAVDPPIGDPVSALLDGLDDEANVVRLAAARALGARGAEVCPRILEVLRHGSDRAKEAALVALEGHGDSVHEDVSAWALEEVDQAARLHRQRLLLAGLEEAPTDGRSDEASACVAYLGFVLRAREARIEELLVHALAVLGAPEAGGRSAARSGRPMPRREPSPRKRSTASAIGASAEPWSGSSRANRTARSTGRRRSSTSSPTTRTDGHVRWQRVRSLHEVGRCRRRRGR